MPRGLGDSPLKREKTRRVIASTVQPDTQQYTGDPTQRSYNDVFFQRRPDLPMASADPALEVESVVDERQTAEENPASTGAAEATPMGTLALQSQDNAQAVAEAQSQVLAVPPVQDEQPVQDPPQEQKAGFLGRIFGRFRKS